MGREGITLFAPIWCKEGVWNQWCCICSAAANIEDAQNFAKTTIDKLLHTGFSKVNLTK
jgi:hypothetical protein